MTHEPEFHVLKLPDHHLQRQHCEVHTRERDDLELLFGRPLSWCPDCGMKL